MSWSSPLPLLKVALSKGPRDSYPFGSDWHQITAERIIRWEIKRGRTDTLAPFDAGELVVEIDNSDRMYDPSNPSGYVYTADGYGLPKCPVEFYLTPSGGSETLRFVGLLGPTCWEGGTMKGSTVTVVAMDALGFSPAIPSESWHAMMLATEPDFWLPMDHGFPVLADGSEVKNRSGSGGVATLVVPGGDTNLTRMSSELGRLTPNLKFSADHKLKIAAADAFPDGDELDVTMCGFERWGTAHGAGEESTVLRLTEPGGTAKRFLLVIDENGDAVAKWYDAAGTTTLDTVTISKPGGRWDDNAGVVFWIVRWTSGNNCEVWVNGYSDSTSIAAAAVYESDVYLGPSDLDPVIDEFCLWRGTDRPIDDEIDGFNLAATGSPGIAPWHGDTYLGDGPTGGSRLDHWCAVARHSPASDQWLCPAYDADYPDGFIGLGVLGNNPSTFAQAIQETVGPLGARYFLTDGRMRIRTVDALTDPANAAYFSTVAAHFTDEDTTLSAPDYRHAGVEQAAPDMNTVINVAEVSWFYVTDLDPFAGFNASIAPSDDASVARYEEQRRTWQLLTYGWKPAAATADAIVDRFADPVVAPQQVTLDAVGDDDLTLWLVETCELELAVDVTYTQPDGTPVDLPTLNIQHEHLSGGPGFLRAELIVGRS